MHLVKPKRRLETAGIVLGSLLTLSPLFGLIGTVLGMMGAFSALGSSGIFLAHNHPSGDPRPSESDRRVTRRLAAAADGLDCTVLDHLVFAGTECTSLRRLGYL